MGPHVMNPLAVDTPQRAMYERWIANVRPPVAKFCRQGFDPGLMDWTRAHGTRVVGRWVEGDISNGRAILGELLQFAGHLDYVEFANEEEQGKDDPKEWDRLCGKALDFLQDLDDANRRAGRNGPYGCVVNGSVGQPEPERWTRPNALALATYMAPRGHAWGLHEYYKPEPWALVIGGKAAWDGVPPARGWLMMRCAQVADIMRQQGVGFRFIITESGRDNVPGQPGEGGGFRDVPGEPYAEYMRQYGRHLSALPECVGWVDFGYNAWEGWRQFDLTEDPAMHERVILAQATLPGTAVTPPAPPPPPPPVPVPVPQPPAPRPTPTGGPFVAIEVNPGEGKYSVVRRAYALPIMTPSVTLKARVADIEAANPGRAWGPGVWLRVPGRTVAT
jgi:hypothetical protein